MLSDIFNDGKVEFGFVVFGVCFSDFAGFFLRSDGCDDGVSMFIETLLSVMVCEGSRCIDVCLDHEQPREVNRWRN